MAVLGQGCAWRCMQAGMASVTPGCRSPQDRADRRQTGGSCVVSRARSHLQALGQGAVARLVGLQPAVELDVVAQRVLGRLAAGATARPADRVNDIQQTCELIQVLGGTNAASARRCGEKLSTAWRAPHLGGTKNSAAGRDRKARVTRCQAFGMGGEGGHTGDAKISNSRPCRALTVGTGQTSRGQANTAQQDEVHGVTLGHVCSHQGIGIGGMGLARSLGKRIHAAALPNSGFNPTYRAPRLRRPRPSPAQRGAAQTGGWPGR